MMNPHEDEFVKTARADAELKYSRYQLRQVWGILHQLVAATVYSREQHSPNLYSQYRDLCEQYGETAIEAKVE